MAEQTISYEDFLESTAFSDGIKVLTANRKDPFCKVELNVPYAIKDNSVLHLQIIKQPIRADDKKFPLIMFVQGSGWRTQNLSENLVHLLEFAKRGYVIAIVEYRPSSTAIFPAQIKDTKTAIRFMIKKAKEYQIDTDKIIVWGDSSGGHTALMTGLTMDQSDFDDEWQKENFSIKAIVDYYGPTDIIRMNEEPSAVDHLSKYSREGLLIGSKNVLESAELLKTASPLMYIKKQKEIPPIIIFHGNKDRKVPFHQSVLLYDCLKENNKEVECYQLKYADHSGPAFWTSEVLDIVGRFIRKYIYIQLNK